MKKQPISSDFFVAGGALKLDTPSYVTRPADDELLTLALAGQFCYVLTPRQMGKSSLMSRTNNRLKAQGVKTAIIDVTRMGSVTVEQWYLGLLTRFQRELGLSVKAYEWWQAHAFLGPVQRFTDFLRDVILTEIETESVVIFIDEIDATLKFEFRDAFFAAIRSMYNARPNDPEFNRLTFILFGVASPPDLIKDRTLTPFNIGQGIALNEFTKEEAKILQDGLEAIYPNQGKVIFNRIYHWTNGYPYLTQKLCLAIAQSEKTDWSDGQIDALVDNLFLSEAARKDSNLQFVQDKTLSHPKRRQLLNLYKKVYQGKKVANDGQSIIQNQLKLSGLLKEEGGYLHTRNNIYRHVFDLAWVKENTAIDWVRIFAGAAALVAILAVSLIAQSTWVEFQSKDAIDTFYKPDTPATERTENLARLFQLQGWVPPTEYDYRARELFYGLQQDQQLAIFEEFSGENGEDEDLIEVVKGLYTTLADVDGNNNLPLLEAMDKALNNVDQTEGATTLQEEINRWLQARKMIQQDQSTQALNEYNEAIALKGDNPATLYERARVLTNLSRDEEALRDLESVITIGRTLSVPVTPTPVPGTTPSEVASTFTPTSYSTPNVTITQPELLTPIPSGTVTALSRQTPMPTATPILSPFTSDFDTPGEMIRAVRNFIQDNPTLIAEGNSNLSQYANLEGVSILPAATPTTVFTPQPTETQLPTSTTLVAATVTRIPPSTTLVAATATPIPPTATLFVATATRIPPTAAPTATLLPTLLPVSTAVFAGYSMGPVAISPSDNIRVGSNLVKFEWQWNSSQLLANHQFKIIGFRDGQYLTIATVNRSLRSIEVDMSQFGNFETDWEWYMVVIDETGEEVSARSATLSFGISLSGIRGPGVLATR